MAADSFRTRFAPSPTGRLHLGHAYSALTAFDAARAHGGEFLLRIEDIDLDRRRDAFDSAILEDLAWLEIEFDGPVRRQSQHLADYHAALDGLRARGLVYRCFRTRREVMDAIAGAPHASVDHASVEAFVGAPLSPEDEARRVAAGDVYAWRLSVKRALATLGAEAADLTFVEGGPDPLRPTPATLRADPSRMGDVVLGRKGDGVAYHLAVVLDDARQGVTHVIRGEDLKEAVHIQRLLQALFGLPTPIYHHHALLRDASGARLAKREGAPSLQSLRAQGITALEIRRRLDRPAP